MDGVFSFLKPPGITSHDAISICRRVLREKRIGHSGTLDPLAYGVLPIFVGKATRIIEYTDSLTKTYVAECCLGYSTDTEDSTGQVIATMPKEECSIPSMEDVSAMVSQFEGPQEQKPSIYSAIKINGKKAYELARAGIAVDLPSRPIHIYECKLLAYAYPYFTVKVTCSSGTYIRSLLRDMCEKLGIPGTMTQLARTAVGSFSINESHSVEELEHHGMILLQPVDRALVHLPAIELPAQAVTALKQGQTWSASPAYNLTHGTHSNSNRNIEMITRENNFVNASTTNSVNTNSPDLLRAYGPDGFFGVLYNKKTHYKVAKNIF